MLKHTYTLKREDGTEKNLLVVLSNMDQGPGHRWVRHMFANPVTVGPNDEIVQKIEVVDNDTIYGETPQMCILDDISVLEKRITEAVKFREQLAQPVLLKPTHTEKPYGKAYRRNKGRR